MLNNPGNANAQFLRHIPCPDKLTYGPAVVPDNRQKASVVGPIQTLCVLLIHPDHLDMLPIYGIGKIISNERSGHSRERSSEAQIDARNPPSRAGRGEKRNVGEMLARYLGSGDVPVIWASRAATAERRLAGITFA